MTQNVMQYCHVCKSQTTSGPPVVRHGLARVSLVAAGSNAATHIMAHSMNSLPEIFQLATANWFPD